MGGVGASGAERSELASPTAYAPVGVAKVSSRRASAATIALREPGSGAAALLGSAPTLLLWPVSPPPHTPSPLPPSSPLVQEQLVLVWRWLEPQSVGGHALTTVGLAAGSPSTSRVALCGRVTADGALAAGKGSPPGADDVGSRPVRGAAADGATSAGATLGTSPSGGTRAVGSFVAPSEAGAPLPPSVSSAQCRTAAAGAEGASALAAVALPAALSGEARRQVPPPALAAGNSAASTRSLASRAIQADGGEGGRPPPLQPNKAASPVCVVPRRRAATSDAAKSEAAPPPATGEAGVSVAAEALDEGDKNPPESSGASAKWVAETLLAAVLESGRRSRGMTMGGRPIGARASKPVPPSPLPLGPLSVPPEGRSPPTRPGAGGNPAWGSTERG